MPLVDEKGIWWKRGELQNWLVRNRELVGYGKWLGSPRLGRRFGSEHIY